MLDWFSGLVGYDGSSLQLGRMIEVAPDGSVLWDVERSVKAEGSFMASVQVSREPATVAMQEWAQSEGGLCKPVVLKVSGNPTKFLQGHNAFGPSVSSLGPVLQGLARSLPVEVRPGDAYTDALPALHRSRVDVAVAVDLGGHKTVHQWLEQAAAQTRSRHGRPLVSGSTVYWGKNSRRWSLKGYCKFCELVDHRPVEGLEELRDYCEGHLRLEVTLRRPELKDRGQLAEDVVWEFYEKVTIGVTEMQKPEERIAELGLTSAARAWFTLWLEGKDIRHELPRRTFYHYRRQILQVAGCDISLSRGEQWGAIERVGFDVAYLKARQVKEIPAGLQPRLFKVA